MAEISRILTELESPNPYQVTLTRGDIKVTGNAEAVAYFLIKLEKEKERKPFPMVVSDLPRFHSDSRNPIPEKGDTIEDSVIKKLPTVREVAKAYINSFGKFYNRSHAIEFIKIYINRKILPRKYRGRILLSIQARQDNRNNNIKSIRESTKRLKQLTNKIPPKRKYQKRDWSSLVIEYMGLEPRPTISKFLVSKGLHAGSQLYFRRYLTRAKSELTRRTGVHFEISELKSSGQKQ